MISEINAKIAELTIENDKIHSEIWLLKKRQHAIRDQTYDLKKEIAQIQSTEFNTLVYEFASIIDGYNLLTSDEIIIITNNMDKVDYTKFEKPRWLDLEKIIKNIASVKTIYTDWKLISLTKTEQYNVFPPENLYAYQFIDSHGNKCRL